MSRSPRVVATSTAVHPDRQVIAASFRLDPALPYIQLDVLPAVSRFSAEFVTVSAVKVTYGVISAAEVVIRPALVVSSPAFPVINPAEIEETAAAEWARLRDCDWMAITATW